MSRMIIGLCGRKHSGKSTAAEAIVRHLEDDATVISLAGPIKETVESMTGACSKQDKEILRPMLQAYGETMKQLYGREYWIEAATRRWNVLCNHYSSMICDDIRFPFEAEWIRSLGGFVIGITSPRSDTSDTHTSETSVDDIIPDYQVTNDGSIYEFRGNILAAVKHYEASIRNERRQSQSGDSQGQDRDAAQAASHSSAA